MSVKVIGVIDLPHVNLKDVETIAELVLFMTEQEIVYKTFNPSEWTLIQKTNSIRLTHKNKSYTWIEIFSDGTIQWDEHYSETRENKSHLVEAIKEYYPMFKKALQIAEKVNARMTFNKEKETIMITVED